jgi:hypothetical protein
MSWGTTKYSVLSNSIVDAAPFFGHAPAIEPSADRFEDFGQRGEVAVLSRQAPSQPPHPLGASLGAVGQQKLQVRLSSPAMKVPTGIPVPS